MFGLMWLKLVLGFCLLLLKKDKHLLDYSPVNPVLRSASFHGTRELTASSSEEEEEEVVLSAEDEDWPVLQAPRVFSQSLYCIGLGYNFKLICT